MTNGKSERLNYGWRGWAPIKKREEFYPRNNTKGHERREEFWTGLTG
jgi:hypothetical protein